MGGDDGGRPMIKLAKLFCGAIALGGVVMAWTLGPAEVIAVSRDPRPNPDPRAERAVVLEPGHRLEIDVVGSSSLLSDLREDERAEQLADWAAYGTLLATNPDAELLRNATYDRLPIR